MSRDIIAEQVEALAAELEELGWILCHQSDDLFTAERLSGGNLRPREAAVSPDALLRAVHATEARLQGGPPVVPVQTGPASKG